MSNNKPEGPLGILGKLIVGETLWARPNAIKDKDGIKRETGSYQWYRGAVAIDGETYQTYVIRNADRGKKIRVSFTYTDGRGNPEQVMSDPKEIPGDKTPDFMEYLYQKYMDRPADAAGKAWWKKKFEELFVMYLPEKYKR